MTYYRMISTIFPAPYAGLVLFAGKKGVLGGPVAAGWYRWTVLGAS